MRDNEMLEHTLSLLEKRKNNHLTPLYICGNSSALSRRLREFENCYRSSFPFDTVFHIDAHEFHDQMIKSVVDNTERAFKEQFYSADLLIVEQIDYLAGMELGMEIMYIVLDKLKEKNARIIVTASSMPRSILRMEDRNIAQFEGGIIYDVRETSFIWPHRSMFYDDYHFMREYGLTNEEAREKAREILEQAGFSPELVSKNLHWDEFIDGILHEPESAAKFYHGAESERGAMLTLIMRHTS